MKKKNIKKIVYKNTNKNQKNIIYVDVFLFMKKKYKKTNNEKQPEK